MLFGFLPPMSILSAVWGFLGAFIYAAPRYRLCIKSCRESGDSIGGCTMEFIIALVTGAISSAAAALPLATYMGQDQDHQVVAYAAVIGLVANKSYSVVIGIFSTKAWLKQVLQSMLKTMGDEA